MSRVPLDSARPSHRSWAVVALLAVVALVAAACGSKSTTSAGSAPTTQATGVYSNLPANAGTPKSGGTLAWGLEAETDSFNPTVGRWALSGHMVGSSILDPLATMGADGKAVPYLARSFTPNANNTVWTITLRPGISYTDGEAFDANAVVVNLNAAKGSLITSKAMTQVQSITATGPLTVQMTVSQPWAALPNLFLSQVGYMLSPNQITGDIHAGDHPIGTRPFIFKEWVKNDHLTVVRNPHYWQKGLPYLDSIVWKPIPDSQQRFQDLEDGTIDAMDTVTPSTITEVRADSSLNRIEYTNGEKIFVVLNTAAAPFNNPLARQAVATATDQRSYIAQMGATGIYQPVTGIYNPGQLGYLANSGYPTANLAKAKQLVAQYQAQTGQPLSFTYSGADDINDVKSEQILDAMWRAAGIKVNVTTTDQATQVVNVVLGAYQASDFRNFGEPDPDADAAWLYSTSIGKGADISINMPRYGTTAIDQGLDTGRASTDPTARNTAYQAVNRGVDRGMPYIWLGRSDWTIAANSNVHGYAAATNGTISTLGPKTWVATLWRS